VGDGVCGGKTTELMRNKEKSHRRQHSSRIQLTAIALLGQVKVRLGKRDDDLTSRLVQAHIG